MNCLFRLVNRIVQDCEQFFHLSKKQKSIKMEFYFQLIALQFAFFPFSHSA